MLVRPALALALAALCAPLFAASVRDHGAVGDGKTDDSAAFRNALEVSDGELLVPAGTYRLRDVHLPDGVTVRGVGGKSVITMPPDAEAAFLLGNDSALTDLRFVGDPADTSSATQTGILTIRNVDGARLSRLTFENIPRAAIYTDHAHHFSITDCRFTTVGAGVMLAFSDHGIISGNFLRDAREHGMQFWGNWKFETKQSSDLIFTGNHIENAGGGGIWGTGATRVVMSGNIVDGAGDVGLDYEWCDDSTIAGNTVRGAVNAGISLFFSCHNISISGNTVVITDGAEGRRDGIWLTGTNKVTFPGDDGHRTVAVTGNTVVAEGETPRHGVNIGGESEGITLTGNRLQNADILDNTGKVIEPAAAARLRETTTVVPLSQEWRFQTDPADEGVTQKWFAPGFDDGAWATIRSDTNNGWWKQGFEGYTGFAWYRTTLPPLPKDLRAHSCLHFGLVDEQAWAYLNGEQVGEHTEQSTGRPMDAIWSEAFSVDVTGKLQADGPNSLTVRVHNAALEGGIVLPVHIIFSDTPLDASQQAQAITAHAANP